MAGPRIKSLTPSRAIKMMVYGQPGIGKTRLVGTGAKTLIVRPPLDHTDSIRGGDAKETVVNNWEDMNGVLEWARHEGSQFSWIWLDSISAFQDQGLDDIWATVIDEKPHRARWGLDQAEYGINMHRLSLWVRHMVGAAESEGFNFGLTAWPRDLPVTEADDSPEALMPWIQGRNMPQKMCGYMNVVAYYTFTTIKKEQRRVLRFASTEDYYAKDQFDAFPDGKLLDPTMSKIEERIKAARPTSSRGSRTRTRQARRKTTTSRR